MGDNDGTWVVLEGPDGAGKTTMAGRVVTALTERGPTVSQHLHSKSAFDEYYGPPRLWQSSGLNVVQDRCAISDLVYAPVLSGVSSRFGEDEVRRQLKLVARRAIVLYMYADEETLAARLSERGDDLITESMLAAILRGYATEMGNWKAQGAVIVEMNTTDDIFADDLLLDLTLSVAEVDLRHKTA